MIVKQDLKKRIQAGEVVHGCWVNLASTLSTEVVARAGFDWILIDLEHGAGDVAMATQQMQVASGLPVTTLVRTEELTRPNLQRILDGGANGIMFPRIDSVRDAEFAVQTMYYPPRGVRGMARQMRATAFGMYADDYLANIEKSMVTIVQIETVEGLDSVEGIAAVPGVDVLFVGPSDLTVSMGIFRQFQHEKYQKAISDVAAACKKHGKSAGVLLQDASEYEMYYKLGYRFLACGSDGSFISKAAIDMAKKLKDLSASMKK
jgi:2-keto-3-deoxy-L-rhamnonate aldolase RhmA